MPVVSETMGMVGGCSGVSVRALVNSSTMGVMRVEWKACEVVMGWVMRPCSSAVSRKASMAVVGPEMTQSLGLLWAARLSSVVSRGVMVSRSAMMLIMEPGCCCCMRRPRRATRRRASGRSRMPAMVAATY